MKVQIPFNISDRTMGRLMQLGDRIWRNTDKKFADWNMTTNHYNVLRILNGAGEPLSQVEISRRLLSSRANVTKVIDHLEEIGFVHRNSCKDRRVRLIELTQKGYRFIADTLQEAEEYAEDQMDSLSKREQKILCGLLGKLL